MIQRTLRIETTRLTLMTFRSSRSSWSLALRRANLLILVWSSLRTSTLFSSSAGVIIILENGAFYSSIDAKGSGWLGIRLDVWIVKVMSSPRVVVVPGLFPVPLFVCCLRLPPDRMFIVRLSLYRTNLLSQECIHMVIKSKFVLFFFSKFSRTLQRTRMRMTSARVY